MKTSIQIGRKICIFQRGQSMTLVNNWTFLQLLFLGKTRREKLCNDLLDRIIAFLDNKNNNKKRSQTLHFSKGVSPWFWSKIGHFSIFLFQAIQPRKMYFYDILERKNACPGYKNKKFKKSKNKDVYKQAIILAKNP